MSKKDEINEAEKLIFREAMRGVKPLVQSKKVIQPAPPPKPFKKKKLIEEDPDFSIGLSEAEYLDPIGSDDLIEFNRPGIHYKILRKLRAGQYNVEAILDLHGMTVAEAAESLQHFLLRCQQKGTRHVLIIHGKGRSNIKPILKNKLNHWLRQIESVLAFCSAIAKDGRGGAVYVLLKHLKGEIVS